MKKIFFMLMILLVRSLPGLAQDPGLREHISMDFDWRFAFGHPFDTKKDFDNGTGYFSYLAKAGYGDGAAAVGFDDRSWRKLDLPHDWAVEAPYDKNGSLSHGFKAVGRNFPERSVGWYRKKISIPSTDLGRHISIAFDGVYRNSIVWVNGHYLGNMQSGYLGFEYDITPYLDYGGENTIAVRVDATMEEGWFYEGAGIYRHTWLNKTNQLHIKTNGTFVSATVNNNASTIHIDATVKNDELVKNEFSIVQNIVDAAGKIVATERTQQLSIGALESKTFSGNIKLADPRLWSIEDPYLYSVLTTIERSGNIVDTYKTTFGIRTIRFDNNEGFFLNGKHVKIMGTNNHQDHAGVGSAIPDALQEFRVKTLKEFGCNAYRCSHNPPTPELLDACDRLGLLVIDENRLTGVTEMHLEDVKRMIERDRNHPCIISWSIGNEEWHIENDRIGARIATTMQAFVNTMDSTRPPTYAFSGGIGSNGITTVMGLLGINYIANKSTDEQHKLFPGQRIWGTEEGSTHATRGAYFRDDEKHIIPAYDNAPNKNFFSIEQGWSHYASRPYLAGMFIWTGFDYRGEPTPYGWPSVNSYFGMVDMCGFPKDDTWYLKSWWTTDTVLHILPHWNWLGKEGKPIEAWVYSNCEEVELFLNKKSLGKKKMQPQKHLSWTVNYIPGKLEAIGYSKGKKIATYKVETTQEQQVLNMVSGRQVMKADGSDVAIVTVDAKDKNGLHVPIADNEITFSVKGPGRIIGVGNGDPVSLEPEKFLEKIEEIKIVNLKERAVDDINTVPLPTYNFEDSTWNTAFTDERTQEFAKKVKALQYAGSFTMPVLTGNETISFFYNDLGPEQSLYINGHPIDTHFNKANSNGYKLDPAILRKGENSIAVTATPFIKQFSWSNINTNPGLIQVLTPAPSYRRKLFNGLAQVIVQSTGVAGEIILTASGKDIKPYSLKIEAK